MFSARLGRSLQHKVLTSNVRFMGLKSKKHRLWSRKLGEKNGAPVSEQPHSLTEIAEGARVKKLIELRDTRKAKELAKAQKKLEKLDAAQELGKQALINAKK